MLAGISDSPGTCGDSGSLWPGRIQWLLHPRSPNCRWFVVRRDYRGAFACQRNHGCHRWQPCLSFPCTYSLYHHFPAVCECAYCHWCVCGWRVPVDAWGSSRMPYIPRRERLVLGMSDLFPSGRNVINAVLSHKPQNKTALAAVAKSKVSAKDNIIAVQKKKVRSRAGNRTRIYRALYQCEAIVITFKLLDRGGFEWLEPSEYAEEDDISLCKGLVKSWPTSRC